MKSTAHVALALVLSGCSGASDAPTCPSQGVFVLTVASDGQSPVVPGWTPLLLEPCAAGTSSPASCPRESLQLTLSFDASSASGTWSSATDAGTCQMVPGYASYTNYGSVDGGSSSFPTCELFAECAGGIDIKLKLAEGGIYGNDIGAGVTIGNCCLVGSAVAQ